MQFCKMEVTIWPENLRTRLTQNVCMPTNTSMLDLLVCEEGKAGPLVSGEGVDFLIADDFLNDCELLLL